MDCFCMWLIGWFRGELMVAVLYVEPLEEAVDIRLFQVTPCSWPKPLTVMVIAIKIYFVFPQIALKIHIKLSRVHSMDQYGLQLMIREWRRLDNWQVWIHPCSYGTIEDPTFCKTCLQTRQITWIGGMCLHPGYFSFSQKKEHHKGSEWTRLVFAHLFLFNGSTPITFVYFNVWRTCCVHIQYTVNTMA